MRLNTALPPKYPFRKSTRKVIDKLMRWKRRNTRGLIKKIDRYRKKLDKINDNGHAIACRLDAAQNVLFVGDRYYCDDPKYVIIPFKEYEELRSSADGTVREFHKHFQNIQMLDNEYSKELMKQETVAHIRAEYQARLQQMADRLKEMQDLNYKAGDTIKAIMTENVRLATANGEEPFAQNQAKALRRYEHDKRAGNGWRSKDKGV